MKLTQEFEHLAALVEQLISLFEESGERLWLIYLRRALPQLNERKLSGATYVLGCFNGEGSMSDLVLASDSEHSDPLRFNNLNARYEHLRNEIFTSASRIASRQLW